ncbi:MAG TPA: polyprenyl synthetase family protein [Candidatus Krumholzibacteria bacterium]|nr:polyprenyl synthetase family protein [Candidatus Krumholzibacteria bacterium]
MTEATPQDRMRSDAEELARRAGRALRAREGAAPRLLEAMEYSLMGGGKRLRPLLALWVHDAAGGSPQRTPAIWNAAIALEMLHTYSLIHDDLPAMDDDDLRRGQLSCHRSFDEATAILAGDALQTLAFELLAEITPPALASACTLRLARSAGVQGMASGQQWDLMAAEQTGGPEVETIHRLKTGALIGASFALGALCAQAEPAVVDGAQEAGVRLGIAFQIVDDILDETASAQELGKSPGKDQKQGKLTILRAHGKQRSEELARDFLAQSTSQLQELSLWSPELNWLCDSLVHRVR